MIRPLCDNGDGGNGSGTVATARATTVATAMATAAMATDSGGSDGDVESNDVGELSHLRLPCVKSKGLVLVIITDSWWAQAIEEQAEDRCHRLGQVAPSSPRLRSDTRKQ